MSTAEEQRLMARIAQLYYVDGVLQPEIAARLDLSQARVSRLLKRAEQEQIVQITISPPPGVYSGLEEGLQERYGLKLAIVVEAPSAEEADVLPQIGAAAAYYLETTLRSSDTLGIASWSPAVLATVDAMRPVSTIRGVTVVQLVGGVGTPSAPVHANWLTQRLANLLKGEPVFLPSPGVAGSVETARALREDPFVKSIMALYEELTVSLAGVGSVGPSDLLVTSGNVFSQESRDELEQRGAIGNICFRFFDREGQDVASPTMERVIGIELDQLRRVPRSILVCGGAAKHEAILAALRGNLGDVLITDQFTASALLHP
jgi:DNA-binding transcriptional regulator LsrR (DeoR family)